MDDERLITFLEELTPTDFARIVARIPRATSQIPDNASHSERVAALVRFVHSARGQGMRHLAETVVSLFPEARSIAEDTKPNQAVKSPKFKAGKPGNADVPQKPTGTSLLAALTTPWTEEFIKRYNAYTDERIRFGKGGFREKYLTLITFLHRTFDIKGLSTQGPHSLDLEKVFVDLSLVSKPPGKAGTSPIAKGLETGRHSVWDFLKPGELGVQHLALIGAPGSGKTTLLKFLALTSAGGKKRSQQAGIVHRVPILLFLRDWKDEICQCDVAGILSLNTAFTIPVAVEAAIRSVDGPRPPANWFARELRKGNCLVLLDGLDEVADAEERKVVVAWVERQMQTFGNNPFVITSRPYGYQSNPLSRVSVLEVQHFTRDQQQRFIHNWYLANEVMSQQKNDEGVRIAARIGADDLLERIQGNAALSDLAVNPLLLTMTATVHRFKSKLPSRRVELYEEICAVFLGNRRAATGLTEELTPIQKQGVLQRLAYELMVRGEREIKNSDAQAVIAEALERVSIHIKPVEFLKSIEHGSGLLVERENGLYGFAHLTFQEYLAAVHAQERRLDGELTHRVSESWWQETIRLYCSRANDATPIISACLNNGSPVALSLAVECEEEAREVQPDVRKRVQAIISEHVESHDESIWKPAAETLLRLRLHKMVRENDDLYVDNRLITHAEYQLFLDEMYSLGNPCQPDHWQGRRFPVGTGRTGVVGVVPSDASAFCLWLTEKFGEGEWRFRLPQATDAKVEYVELGEGTVAGVWITDSIGVNCERIDQVTAPILKEELEPLNLYFANALVRDLDRGLERHLGLDLDRNLDLIFTRARTLDIDLDLDRALARALAHDLDRDRARIFVRDIDLDRTVKRDCALDHAFDLDLASDPNDALDLVLARANDDSHPLSIVRIRALSHAVNLARVRGFALSRSSARALVLSFCLSRALALDHALDRDLVRAHALDHRDLDRSRAHDLARYVNRIRTRARVHARVRAVVPSLDISPDIADALSLALDLDLDHHRDLDLIVALTRAYDRVRSVELTNYSSVCNLCRVSISLYRQYLRIIGALPAWEGIRIVRERIKTSPGEKSNAAQ